MPAPKSVNDMMQEILKKAGEKSPSRPVKPIITPAQTNTLLLREKKLMPQFKKAIAAQNLADAKIVIADLQEVLRTLNKTNKLEELKNQLFELALEQEKYTWHF